MTKFIWHNGDWVDTTGWTRPAPVFPGIIRDTMEPLRSMASGRMHDSKSALRAEYRELGYVELGNDAPTRNAPFRPDPDTEKDINEAWNMLEQGYQPDPTPRVSDGEFANVETRMIDV